MTSPLTERYVVANVGEAKGSLAISYLTRRGKSMDEEKRAQGHRDWQPLLDSDIERFTTREEADSAAEVYGGRVVDFAGAAKYEAWRGANTERPGPERGL